METTLDVLGIGNAIVDVLSHEDDSFLSRYDLKKGAMTLIDAVQAKNLYDIMGSAIEVSGGSAANTLAGVASLGGRAGYIGKVAADQLGEVFSHDMRSVGVRFETQPLEGDVPTARCLVMVTPDAQRTMSTYLGACVALGPDDVQEDMVAEAKVTYLEGYLWDPPQAKSAFLKAAEIAHAKQRKVSLSLSDAFCVDRHRESFLGLVEGHIDVLFANEVEIMSLYEVNRFEEAVENVRRHCEVAALTRSEKGAVIVGPDGVHEVPAAPVERVVDTTGAGDLYAAGFLYGLTHGKPLPECGRLGAVAAAEVISHFGARPETALSKLIA